MNDDKFGAVGILAWYKKDLDNIIDLVAVGNASLEESGIGKKQLYGNKFTDDDLLIKEFNE